MKQLASHTSLEKVSHDAVMLEDRLEDKVKQAQACHKFHGSLLTVASKGAENTWVHKIMLEVICKGLIKKCGEHTCHYSIQRPRKEC